MNTFQMTISISFIISKSHIMLGAHKEQYILDKAAMTTFVCPYHCNFAMFSQIRSELILFSSFVIMVNYIIRSVRNATARSTF